MKHLSKLLLAAGLAFPALLSAQQRVTDVDRAKYPDYSTTFNPDESLRAKPIRATKGKTKAADALPDHVNNAENMYFPPVFNQDGGSCGSASRISYMFSYELAAYRNLDGSKPENYYPSHFVWLHTYAPNGQGKDEFVQFVGVPSAATYGGQTYSSLFGNQDTEQDDFGWMQGYDKWFEAMHNRMLKPQNFPQSIATEEGRNAVKRWLYNHNGDNDFHAGGICGIGVASGGVWKNIPKTATNDAIGVTGKYYVKEWGTQVDHALTIVGYDDRIEFDLDGDGVYGEAAADERGAWIIVNSWGNTWCNKGFIYCPYAFGGSAFKNDGNPGERTFNGDFWWPEIYHVRKDYRPLRTIKLEMEYSRRSEIALSAGVSSDLSAEKPQKSVPFIHFIYSGDGNYGNTNPAPEIPMLGRWADGKLHTEPMEFGYDLTDLSATFDKNMPLKYFFIVDTKTWAQGKGKIHKASIIDYEHDPAGIETPFDLSGEGVEIKNAGEQTIISVVVYGQGYFAPQNPSFDGATLSWQTPMRSSHIIQSYNIYADDVLIENVGKDVQSYQIDNATAGNYSITAVYEDGTESAKATVNAPIANATTNTAINLKQSGFTIPNIFSTKFEQATIEFYINPTTLTNWNQSGGPGWGTFMFHANADGRYTAGWDTGNRVNSSTTLSTSTWKHVAMVIDRSTLTLYINGKKSGSVNSSTYSGVGGFGDLTFSANGTQNAQNARYDEIRIWNYARSATEVQKSYNVEYTGSILPQGLIAYYKGDTLHTADGTVKLRDCVGGNHATILNSSFQMLNISKSNPPRLVSPTDELAVSIDEPAEPVYAGIPTTFTATHSQSTNALKWTAAGAGVENLAVASPTLTFSEAGQYTISVEAANAKGETVTATRDITVNEIPDIDAGFKATKTNVPAGERVTFLVNKPVLGYLYEWSMPGADVEKVTTMNAAASYQAKGDYTVTLTVTAPDGQSKSSSVNISVVEVAPVAAFTIAPGVILKGENTFLRDQSKFAPNKWLWHICGPTGDYIINGQNSSFSPDKPGIYDVTLTASNNTGSHKATRERGLIVCNADSKNGLNFGTGGARLTATKVPFTTDQNTFSIEWWMNSGRLATYCNGIGDSEASMMLKTNATGAMELHINSKSVSSGDDFIIPGEWHHYAVTFNNRSTIFYRDGIQFSKKSIMQAKLPAIANFSIGTATAPQTGQMDEFRVWNKALSLEQLKEVANAPITDIAAAEANGLVVYYSFNQSGGDVQDGTTNSNHGVRSGFGPDGDAWGLSKGVFSLNFEANETKADISADYLKNYKKAFSSDASKCVNPQLSSRTFAIKDWTLENTIVNGSITTGAHVDKAKNNCFTVTTGWDNFASALTDHKVYQTITLPEGSYTFTATYDGTYEGQSGSSYIVAATGKGLPNTDELNAESLAHQLMLPKSGSCAGNSITFVLTEETEVSLGLVVNMNGQLCMTIQNFTLTRSNVTSLEADGANGYDLEVDATGYSSLYLPYPVEIPEGVVAYCVTNVDETTATVTLEAIGDGVIPARTGVIIETTAGTHHFNPASQSGTATSLMVGHTEDTNADTGKSYYAFTNMNGEKQFSLLTGSLLPAHRAFLEVPSGSLPEVLSINIVETGIGQLITPGQGPAKVYDLSGRRVKQSSGGIYIINGQKVVAE